MRGQEATQERIVFGAWSGDHAGTGVWFGEDAKPNG